MAFLEGRRVVTRSPHRRVGYINYPWFQEESIAYESLLERGFVRIALLCPGVQRIQSQPFKIVLGSGLRYTPDYLLTIKNSMQLVVEVKPREHVPKHQEKLDAAAQRLCEEGYDFLVCTDESILRGGRHDRAAKLLRQAQSSTTPEHCARVASVGGGLRFPTTLEDLTRLTGLGSHQVCGALGRRSLALGPDLCLEKVYPADYIEENGHGISSYSAWLSARD